MRVPISLPAPARARLARLPLTLISWRKGTVPSDRAMTATEFTNLMNKISYEWASLPPGRYGQPIKTMSQLRTEYCKLAGC